MQKDRYPIMLILKLVKMNAKRIDELARYVNNVLAKNGCNSKEIVYICLQIINYKTNEKFGNVSEENDNQLVIDYKTTS